MTNDNDDPIRKIAQIRIKNNELWMSILNLALEVAPDRARELVRAIRNNDKEISEWFEKL